ncbi:aminotransferase class I/II-fold pyridoxal phosphate-dependent enzyme [Lentibacillus sediminis]|uniref:aminotransferase class I/II-fold pyridoxal phosphate-dependent enzyme n=1 Tax=Lentibacillus sediminis TaxID=1940529 RepID=UPI000C1BF3A9|nr:aminotransferase class I/II-fold pyridoxal phosphate-dependent enzyme [Lentibacillus sediminis]
MIQYKIPLFEALQQFHQNEPTSFHVPGHKNGSIFPKQAENFFASLLQLDLTELPGLDDLHAPSGVIAEAEELAAEYFRSEHTFFLVGGSTAGNLAMILATCSAGDKVIVQRNAHKSVMNGLELSGARPILIAPEFDASTDRYTGPDSTSLKKALEQHPDAKAVVLTYPDYFGCTYPLKEMIDLAHRWGIPVLVDEAHGVHFSLGEPFPLSAVDLGADAVVQSAHKMAPAMTMAAYLHMNSGLVSKQKIAHYLQMIQSSSPSYPLLASLDLARAFLAEMTPERLKEILLSVKKLNETLAESDHWELIPANDPLKIMLQMNPGISAQQTAWLFEQENIYPELATHNQILFIHGLAPFEQLPDLKKKLERINTQLKNTAGHATIETAKLFFEPVQELEMSYQEMNQLTDRLVPLRESAGHIAAEAVIPYPPGIPLILKGERITQVHIDSIVSLLETGVRLQQREEGIRIY